MVRKFSVAYCDKPTVFFLDFEDIKNADNITITVADTDKVEAEVAVKCSDGQAEEESYGYTVAPVFEQGTLRLISSELTDKVRTEYRITIPNIPMIHIRSLSADIDIRKYHGLMKIENASGSIKLSECIPIDSCLESHSGNISVEGKVINRLDVATFSGDISLDISKKEDYRDRFGMTEVTATSRSGNIQITSRGVPIKQAFSLSGSTNVTVK